MTSRQSIDAGRAQVTLALNDREFDRKLKSITTTMKTWGKSMRQVGTIAVAAGTAIFGAFAGGVKILLDTGDALQKMSIRTGATVEELSALGFAAQQTGSSLETLGGGLFRMTRRIGNAATGTGPAVRALEALGLSAEELSQKTSGQQFETIVAELAKVENAAFRSQLGFEIFGNAFQQLKPLIDTGADGIKTLTDQARDLGIVLDSDAADAAAAFNDEMVILKDQSSALLIQLGLIVVEGLKPMISWMQQIIPPIIQWVKENRRLVTGLAVAGGALLVTGAALLAFASAMFLVAASGAAATIGLAPFLIILVAIAVAGFAIGVALSGSFDDATKSVGKLKSEIAGAIDSVNGLGDAAGGVGQFGQLGAMEDAQRALDFESERRDLLNEQLILKGRISEEDVERERLKESGLDDFDTETILRLRRENAAIREQQDAADAAANSTVQTKIDTSTRATTADISAQSFLGFGAADNGVAMRQLRIQEQIAASTARTADELASLETTSSAALI